MSEKVERPLAITAAAILFGIMGVLQLSIRLSITWDISTSYQKTLPVIIIIAMLAQPALSMAVAYGLLKLKRWAGILGIVMEVIQGVILIGLTGVSFDSSLILNLVKIALIALGWKSLR